MTTAVIFPGQGVQRVGMGAGLFERFPDLTAEADEILGYSVQRLCIENHDGLLDDTRYTQPAVFVVNALSYRSWLQENEEPDLALGHSLGEFNALEAGGAFDFAAGLRLVQARARLTARIPGGMTAVLGMSEGEVRRTLFSSHRDDVEIVNFNAPTQLVLAGPLQSLACAEEALRIAGAFDIRRLAVSGPFHSSYMADVAVEFGVWSEAEPITGPRFPVLANRTAQPHRASEIRRTMAEHIDHPVLWHASIVWILEHHPEARIVETGEPGILTRMVRRIRPDLSHVVS
jgi:malonyl CoA-acyl carrier protein transacylase